MNSMKKILTPNRVTILLIILSIALIWWNELSVFLNKGSYDNPDAMAETIMDKSGTPGIAMIISNKGAIEYKGYGYADVLNKKPVNEESLFQLGSTTKAFTALAVLLLENEGYLKRSNQITEYLPWFLPTYKGEQVPVTIDHLLTHTSGIPHWSVKYMPEGSSEELLEKTIRNISTIDLNSYPGTKHDYATINYDVLALIIEKVTGQRYQDFVTQRILLPLGMKDSYFSTGQETKSDKLTKGYRKFFCKSIEYNAPRYYGNIAAGYLVSNSKDLGCWLNAQMGAADIPDNLKTAILQSHEVGRNTAGLVDQNTYYSFGWINDIKNNVIKHSGSNPNYSTQVIIDLDKQSAVFVLANLDSTVPTQIADNVLNCMNGEHMDRFSYDDVNILLDVVFSFLAIISAVFLCTRFIMLVGWKKQSAKNNRKIKKKHKIIISLLINTVFLIFIIVWPYLFNYTYYLLRVWMPITLLIFEGIAALHSLLSLYKGLVQDVPAFTSLT